MAFTRPVTVRDLCDFLEVVSPPVLGESWDNLGLLLGEDQAAVNRVLTCLTLTPEVAQEAIDIQAQLIVTHHPILFKPIQKLNCATAEGRMLLSLARHNIAVFCSHTAYDNTSTGINQQLAELLELTDIKPLRSASSQIAVVDFLSVEIGAGRYGRLLQPISLSELIEVISSRLNQPWVSYVGDRQARIETIGIACGAAADFLKDACRVGCQAFLTGEARFHACLEARQSNVALILPGHYATERPAMENLAKRIATQFPQIRALASSSETDPLELFFRPG